jgi:hypothetical protein
MRAWVLTRTKWREPPRLRHQLTELLWNLGWSVTFFERPSLFGYSMQQREVTGVSKNSLMLMDQPQIAHHQLRPFGPIQSLNARLMGGHMRRAARLFGAPDLIVNFNYDYGFLVNVFPTTPLITVLNDDFIAQGKPWMKRAIARAQQGTCQASDIVLAVSSLIADQVRAWSKDVRIFYPWVQDAKVVVPRPATQPLAWVLYYGYINHRVRWDVIEHLLGENVNLRMVGPVEGRKAHKFLRLLGRRFGDSLQKVEPRSIENIELGGCIASIAPYDPTVPSVQAIELSNRMLRLLRMGLPIIAERLPGLLQWESEILRLASHPSEYLLHVRDIERAVPTSHKW